MASALPPPVPPRPRITFDTLINPLEITAAGRPELLDGEIELHSSSPVTLYAATQSGDLEERLRDGTAVVTTHRLLWLGFLDGVSINVAIFLLKISEAIGHPGGRWKNSHKILLRAVGQDQESPPVAVYVKKGRNELLVSLESALQRKAWVKATVTQVLAHRAAAGGGVEERTIGIAGLLKRQEQNRAATTQIASEAFTDLKSLIDKAKEVVAVMERYQAMRATIDTNAAAEGGEGQGAGDLSNMLVDIGIASPVTKEMAGSKYHEQLARQLADFLIHEKRGILKRFGGVVSLTDVYALFNRARGTELISPQDLLAVSRLLQPLGLGLRLKTFSSGVTVIQEEARDDAAVLQRLASMASEGPIMIGQCAKALGISVLLAKESLNAAEQAGALCRDETIEGVRYYPNSFIEFERQYLIGDTR